MRAGIFGIGAALPEHVVTNAHFEARLETTDAWIVKRTGIRERRHLNGSLSLAQLATTACADALADAGRDASEVDQIIVTTITPDLVTPGLAPAIAAELGADRAGAVDLNAACAGFLYGLDQAAALVEAGRADVVIVCAAEALSAPDRLRGPGDGGPLRRRRRRRGGVGRRAGARPATLRASLRRRPRRPSHCRGENVVEPGQITGTMSTPPAFILKESYPCPASVLR